MEYKVGQTVYYLDCFAEYVGIEQTYIRKMIGEDIWVKGKMGIFRPYNRERRPTQEVLYPTFDDAMRAKVQYHFENIERSIKNALEGLAYLHSDKENTLSKIMAEIHNLRIN